MSVLSATSVAALVMAPAASGAAPSPAAGAPDVVWVPASAHAAGVNGASWRTDVEVHNPGPTAATFTVELLPQNTDNGASRPDRNRSLAPQASARYTDILTSLFGVEGAAALRFTTTSGSILVTSRTYNLVGPNGVGLPVGASFGQFVPGLADGEAITYGEEGRLVQLTHQPAASLDGFRTNVGIVNATSQTIEVTIDLYAADASRIGTASGDDTRLRPYEFRQLNALFGRFTAACADCYAVVKTTTPGGRLFAFASVVDNHASGDPIFVPATRVTAASSGSNIFVPASAHAAGVNGASWRTDVEVHNPGPSAATFTVELLRQNTDNGGSVPSRSFSLGPQTSTRYRDILASLFGVEGAAALRFTTASGSILVTSRTYNLVGPNDVGLPVGASFSQFVPGLPADEAIAFGEEGRLVQLTHQPAASLDGFRTNLGIVNATSQTIEVTIDLYAADGSLLGGLSGDDTRLRPYEFRQLNALYGRFAASCADGYAVVRTPSPGGRLFAFASVVDNHASGDPVFIPATRVVPVGPLALYAPSLEAPLLSLVPASLQVGARRASEDPLTFALLEGPAAAAIDTGSGRIAWTPPASAEGTSAHFRVSATDGQTTADVAFTAPVASTSSVATSLSGSTLTVTQPGALQGVTFGLPAQLSSPASELRVSSVDSGQTAPLPEGVVRVSDFFRVTPVEASGEDGITVTIPARIVPAGLSPSELLLFFYSSRVDGVAGPVWVGVANGLDVLPGGNVTVKVHAFDSLCFIGYRTPTAAHLVAEEPDPARESVRSASNTLGVTVSCAGKQLANGTVDPLRKVCKVTGDDVLTVTVTRFDPNPWQPAATLEELIGWLVAGRQKLTALGMSASPVFEVVLEPMPQPTWLGFAASSWSGRIENYGVLHLSNAAKTKKVMQSTAVHEYFHHAQARTVVAGMSNAILDVGTFAMWLYEATARWFEDEVFDGLDIYKDVEFHPVLQVLSAGLDAADTSAVAPPAVPDPYSRSYARFAFFKMVSTRCPGFSLRKALNWDDSVDVTGIFNFASGLASADWRCDFGPGFGDANSAGLASALLYYVHATLKENRGVLLDANEESLTFQPTSWRRSPAECPPPAACPRASTTGSVPIRAASAWALEVSPIANLAADKEVALEVEIGTPPVWVWIGDDAQHKELGAGTWFSARGVNRYVYGQQGSAPRLFVAVVNPSPDLTARVTVRAIIRPRGTVLVPFNLTSTFNGVVAELKFPDVTSWTITSSGDLSGPVGTTITETGTYMPWQHLVNAAVKGAKAPIVLGVAGTFDAVVTPASGTVRGTGQESRSWTYFNKRLSLDCSSGPPEAPPGPIVTTMSLNLSRTITSAQSQTVTFLPCILYDLTYRQVDFYGKVQQSWTKTIQVGHMAISFSISP